ncbi:MAG: biotin--[acetyl-CoA-carboxylase] ligase [Phycisphaerae bacterium]|nr:biotin--[acetyl-CoA-carboxylase] ligase [Phycisphaerae bacterium]
MSAFAGLEADRIESRLRDRIGRKVVLYKSTSSTNDIAWQYASNRDNDGLCVFAEAQEAGRGRQGRRWQSAAGESILCSALLLDSHIEGEMVTLAAAVAVCEAVAGYVRGRAQIKWPNDVCVDGRKVAGILVESRPERPGKNYVVGIGINCHQDAAFFGRLSLRAPATSVDLEGDGPVDRNALAADVLNALDRWFKRAEAGDGAAVISRWKEMSRLLGLHVVLDYDQRRFAGHCVGVDPVKGLILQLERGGVRMFDAAHTTMVRQITLA